MKKININSLEILDKLYTYSVHALYIVLIIVLLLLIFRPYIRKQIEKNYNVMMKRGVVLGGLLGFVFWTALMVILSKKIVEDVPIYVFTNYSYEILSGLVLILILLAYGLLKKMTITKNRKFNKKANEEKKEYYYYYFNPIKMKIFLEVLKEQEHLKIFFDEGKINENGRTLLNNSLNELYNVSKNDKINLFLSYFGLKSFYKCKADYPLLIVFFMFISNNTTFEDKRTAKLFYSVLSDIDRLSPFYNNSFFPTIGN